MRQSMDAQELQALSRLFSYPDNLPEARDLDCIARQSGRDFGEMDLIKLQNEYVRLFINALPEVPCPPYGSVYLESCLMGESTVRLARLYHSYGFITGEMPDHIAVELEFLAVLNLLGEEIQEESIARDRDLVAEHMKQWTPRFLDQVQENDRSGFYCLVSRYAANSIIRHV